MSPIVRLAEKRWEGRGATHHFYDEMVIDCEQAFGFQVHPVTGKSYAPESLIEGRQRAWHRLARAHIQMKAVERAERRKQEQREAMADFLDLLRRRNFEAGLRGTDAATRRPAVSDRPPPLVEQNALDPERGPPVRSKTADLEYGTSLTSRPYEAAHGLREVREEVTLR
jgi:hypothetical protein